MALQLIGALRSHAARRPAAPAAVSVSAARRLKLNYGDLYDRVDRLQKALRLIVPSGGTVVLCYPNHAQYLAAFTGILAAGRTLFPISFDSAAPELMAAARRVGASAAIMQVDRAAALRPCFQDVQRLEAFPDDAILMSGPAWQPATAPGPALLLQSSGTTGQPKIVRRDGPALDAVARNMVRACGFTREDRVLACVPLSHSYGMEHGILAPLWAGSCVHVCQGFDLSVVLPELRDAGITMLPGVPFMFELLCQASGIGFGRLRRAYSAGGPLPSDVVERFHRQSGIRIGQVYGASEVGSVTFNDPDDPTFDPGCVGTPMDAVSIRIVDVDNPTAGALPSGHEGQVAVAAPSMFSGYLDSAAPLVDGHYLTGDLGLLDNRGRLRITGRLTLLIDVGGRKVNAAEVEAVFRQHPDVGQCIVVPLRLAQTVCRLRAIVTPARSGVELSPGELRRFARERLSAYKVPRLIEVRTSLPTSPAGKVLRHLVETTRV